MFSKLLMDEITTLPSCHLKQESNRLEKKNVLESLDYSEIFSSHKSETSLGLQLKLLIGEITTSPTNNNGFVATVLLTTLQPHIFTSEGYFEKQPQMF